MAEAPADYNKLARSLTLPDGSHLLLERCPCKVLPGADVCYPVELCATCVGNDALSCLRCRGTGLVLKPYSMERVMAALAQVGCEWYEWWRFQGMPISFDRKNADAITAAFLKAARRALEARDKEAQDAAPHHG